MHARPILLRSQARALPAHLPRSMMEARLSRATVTRAWRCGDAIRAAAACTAGTHELGKQTAIHPVMVSARAPCLALQGLNNGHGSLHSRHSVRTQTALQPVTVNTHARASCSGDTTVAARQALGARNETAQHFVTVSSEAAVAARAACVVATQKLGAR